MVASGLDVSFIRFDSGSNVVQRSLPLCVSEYDWLATEDTSTIAPDPRAVTKFRQAFENALAVLKPDIVHAGPIPTCGYLAALVSPMPLLVMSWGSDVLVDADRDDVWLEATRYAVTRASVVQCDCLAVRSKICSLADVSEHKIVQFPWGIDLALFSPCGDVAALREARWTNKKIVLCNRAWTDIHGVDTVLQVFLRLCVKRDDVVLVLIGAGPKAEEVHRFLNENKLMPNVFMPGPVENQQMPMYLRLASVYLSCSRCDGSSISLVEALSIGLPVIVSDIAGNGEWVSNDEGSRLVVSDDVDGYVSAVDELLDLQIGQRSRVSHKHRRIVEERANWSTNWERLLAAYERMKHG